MKNEVIIGDCRDILPTFPDKSFDLAILDPPYYKIVAAEWDNQWRTFEEYLDWLENICLDVKRVLKDNGSLYVFGDDHRISYVQARLDKHFTFLNHLIWYKRNNQSIKGAENSRRFACVSERILFYANGSDTCPWDQTGLERIKLDVNNFENLRQYFKKFQYALRCNKKEVIETVGQKADHCFRWGSTQWDMPTPETYEELLRLPRSETFEVREYEDLRREYEDLRREYEDLRREYEDLRREYEDLRRPFNPLNKQYELFDIPMIGGRENTPHPSTKPKELYKRLIQCSTNEGALILDPFAGSGTSLIAAKETGRYCIAIEKEEQYLPIILERGQLNTCTLSNFEEVV